MLRRAGPTILVLLTLSTVARGETWMIVAFGDSTTAPRRVEGKPLTVYADVLAKELPVRGVQACVVNSGIGGHTTEHARRRFQRDVLAFRPTAVIVQFGINDSAIDVWRKPPAKDPRVSLARYERNLVHFVTTLRQQGACVILMTPNPLRWTDKLKGLYGSPPYDPDDADGFNVLLKEYATKVREIAARLHVALVDVYTAFEAYGRDAGQSLDDLLLDGMHPNETGQRLVARLLLRKLLDGEGNQAIGKQVWQGGKGGSASLSPLCSDVTPSHNHDCISGVSLVRLAGERVMTVYSVGNPYGPAGSTYLASRVSSDGGKTWTPEQEFLRHPECQACGPSLLRSKDGTIHLFYLGFHKHEWKDGNPTPNDRSDLWTVRSEDDGATWSKPQRIYHGYTGATNGAIETRQGGIVVPFSHYVSNPGRLVSRTAVSKDHGRTWQLSSKIDIGGSGDHAGAIEPTVIQRADGSIGMLIRTTRGAFWQSFSDTAALQWSPAVKTTISATSAPGHLCRLAGGQLALAYNPLRHGRHDLRLIVSKDDAKTWTHQAVLAWGRQVTYPFVHEVSPSDVWVAFNDVVAGWGHQTCRIVRLSPSWRETSQR